MKSKRCNKPLVSIGMPIYNGERYVREALDSLLAQDYEDFELIISDNASTDSTFAICQEYSERDKRIRLHRNKMNIGASKNFNSVFELSSGKYFMWVAHDDFWDRTYIRKCLAKLQILPTAVVCCSDIKFIKEDGSEKTDWTVSYSNLETVGLNLLERVHELICKMGWYAIYGLIRRDALEKTTLLSDKYGADVIILMELLLLGDFAKVPEPLFYCRIPNTLKTTDDYMQDFNPDTIDKTPEKPYTFLAKELIKIVVGSDINDKLKIKIKDDFINTLSFQNLDWREKILQENTFGREQEVAPQDLYEFIGSILFGESRIGWQTSESK